MIIGVTGSNGAGKDSVAEVLQKMNFYHVSLSDFLREELKRNNKAVTRDNLIAKGNELRNREGAGALALKALTKIKDGENFVFTSIRNPEEVRVLNRREDFVMVHVTASDKIRVERLKKRGTENDPTTLAELRDKEAKENTSDPKAQQLNKVAKMAKIVLKNEGTLEELEQKVGRIVNDWLFKLQDSRPDWDHYFMNIAEEVKMRCNCMSAKKGAILVRDKQILSTGYNGTPKGIKHCTTGGCPRCTSRHLGLIKSGVYSEPCICAHAEENAIVQAAYNGISTKGATMYTTFTPCTTCSKMIINAGIKRVVAKVLYPDDVGLKMLKEAGVKFEVIK